MAHQPPVRRVFKKRYAATIRRAVETDRDAFRQALVAATGNTWGRRLWDAAVNGRPEISAQWSRSLRAAVWFRAFFSSPVQTTRRYFAYALGEVKRRLAPPVPWIAIVGREENVTAAVKEITERFEGCPYVATQSCPWRPRTAVRITGPNTGSAAHAQWTVGCAVDWLIRYWTHLVHCRAKGYIPVVGGLPVDLLRDGRHAGNEPGLARIFRTLLPQPDLVFAVDRTPEEKVFADEVQHAVRAWIQHRTLRSFGSVQLPLTATGLATTERPSSGASGVLIHDERAR